MIGIYFVPIWHINLFAPQYPEGMYMQIWLHKMTGDVRNINILNHYIGMHPIVPNQIPELRYLPWGVAFLILGAFVSALIKNIWMIRIYASILLASALGSFYDFWLWGYRYGHDLDPHASIKMPGMTYQPPLIGPKTLLNITAWSIPGIGGWLFGIAIVLILGAFYFREKSKKKK
jgi:copper chaperone NosL